MDVLWRARSRCCGRGGGGVERAEEGLWREMAASVGAGGMRQGSDTRICDDDGRERKMEASYNDERGWIKHIFVKKNGEI